MENEIRAESKSKVGLRAPCVYEIWDERNQKYVEAYPAVGCNHVCDRCGWNPAVAEKRMIKIREKLGL